MCKLDRGYTCISLKRWVRWQPTTQNSTSNLSGLALARYVLKRITRDGDTVNKLAEGFDGNRDFVLSVIFFLKDIGWLKEEQSGEYTITAKGASEQQQLQE